MSPRKKKSMALVGVDRPTPGPVLSADSTNRAIREFFNALIIEVLLAIWPIISNALDGTAPIELPALGLSVLRIGLLTAGQYVMRRHLDPSSIPTPLPPD